MNRFVLGLSGAAVVVMAAVVTLSITANRGGVGAVPTPSPSPALLARAVFVTSDSAVELEAFGEGSNVTGRMTVSQVSDEDAVFTVDLQCSRTTEDGLIMIGGVTTNSTVRYLSPEGTRAGIVLKRGSPVEATIWSQRGGPTSEAASCLAYLDAQLAWELRTHPGGDWLDGCCPIEGTVELGAATQPSTSTLLAIPTPTPTASPSPVAAIGPLPAEQADVIARQIAALNSRDAEALLALFGDDPFAGFDPRGVFEASSIGNFFVASADRDLIEPYMAINDAWRFEAEVVACYEITQVDYDSRYSRHSDNTDLYGHCEVRSRWPALSLEIGEWWSYEFRGTEILWWDQHIRDAMPADRTLALGLDGLLEWESWLESTDPQAAARLLNPREFVVTVPCGPGEYLDENDNLVRVSEPPCTWSSEGVDVERITSSLGPVGSSGVGVPSRVQHDWVFAGERFSPSALIPYDPAMAPEIEASIQEFLGR